MEIQGIRERFMNKYDEVYNIYLAKKEDIDDIMEFIRENWDDNHILGTNKDFFKYEHVIDGNVTFLIARNKKNGFIDAILGYILASGNQKYLDVWTGLWKTRAGAMTLLGMELMKRLPSMLNARTLSGVGDNPNTTIKLLNTFMKSTFFTGRMQHYYALSNILDHKIAVIKRSINFTYNIDNATCVRRMKNIQEIEKFFDFNEFVNMVPFKDAWYLNRRYFKHPIYQYQIYGLSRKDKIDAILVAREQKYNGSKILRIVDYIGNYLLFAGLGKFFNERLKEYEYIDFYTLGVDPVLIEASGMVLREEKDLNIIPNYFYPYEKKNIDIWVDSSYPNTVFVKGDGDQDRPNR